MIQLLYLLRSFPNKLLFYNISSLALIFYFFYLFFSSSSLDESDSELKEEIEIDAIDFYLFLLSNISVFFGTIFCFDWIINAN